MINMVDELVEFEHVCEQKDAMRVDCIPDIVNSWATILQSGHVALTNQCLEVYCCVLCSELLQT